MLYKFSKTTRMRYLCQIFFLLSVFPMISFSQKANYFPRFVSRENFMLVNSANRANELTSFSSNKAFSYFINLLITTNLYGKWQWLDHLYKKSPKPKEGFTSLSVYRNTSPQNNLIWKFCFYGNNHNYSINQCIKIPNFIKTIQKSIFNEDEMAIQLTNIWAHFEDTEELDSPLDCKVNLTLSLTDVNNAKFFPTYNSKEDISKLAFKLKIQSNSCPMDLNARVIPAMYEMSLVDILDYFIDIVLVGFTVQLLAAHWVSETLSSGYQQISLGKLIVIHAFDFYVAFQYWIGYINNIRSIKSIPAPSIMMILAFMSSMLHAVAQRQKNITEPGYFAVKYLNYGFWLSVSMIAIISSLIFKEHRLILALGCLQEVPQIIQNFITQMKHTWSLTMLFFLSFPKILFIGWTLMFSDVILGYSCRKELKVYVFLIILQFTLLAIQTKRPRIISPAKTPYKILNEFSSECREEVCSICLETHLQIQHNSFFSYFWGVSKEEKGVLTPCQHRFHICCLKNWVKQNYSCPYCRCSLPQLLP